MVACEVFRKDFENLSFRILEGSIWLQLIYFLAAIAFWFVKYIFLIDADTLTTSRCELKILLCVVYSSTDNFLSPIPVSVWLIFCCGNLILTDASAHVSSRLLN